MKIYLDKFKTIYCIGDCYTAGQDNERKYGYPYFLQLLLGEGYLVENLGRANIQIHSILDYPKLFMPDNPAYNSCAFLWCGSNDFYLGLSSEEEIFIKYVELATELEKKEVLLFHLTLLRRRNTPLVLNSVFEERRVRFNKKLIEKYSGNVLDIYNELHFQKYFTKGGEHLSYNGYKQVGKKCYEFLKEKGF